MNHLKIKNTLILLFCICRTATGQIIPFAVINDKDGFTNIRLGTQRKIADKLYNNQVFAIRSIVDDDGWQDWYWIDYPDYASARAPFEKYITKTREGMMHKSRIKPLTDLLQWQKTVQPDSQLVCHNGTDRITIRYGRFIAADHRITYQQPGVVMRIDGSAPWGIDGALPPGLTEIKSITLEKNGKKYPFPKNSIKNMLMPTTITDHFGIAEGSNGTLFLYMANSDAAGSYAVVWTLKKGAVVSQFIYRDF